MQGVQVKFKILVKNCVPSLTVNFQRVTEGAVEAGGAGRVSQCAIAATGSYLFR